MELLQNYKIKHPTIIEKNFSHQKSQDGFLDLEDILYPERRQQNQSHFVKIQQSLSIQITHQMPTLPRNHQIGPKSHKEMVQLHSHINQTNHISANQGKNQRKGMGPKQSKKHNFPKHLVRKIKDLMKKILNIKKKAKIQGVSCVRKLYFYFFHQNLRKHENIHIFHLFLEHQDQISSLQKDFQQQVEQHGIKKDINLELMNSLRFQLRKSIFQSQEYLISLIEKGQIGKKQEFTDFIKQFLLDIRAGIVRPAHK